MNTEMSNEELRALVAGVQVELDSYLGSERDKLSKAHPGEEDSSELPADESATASPPESSDSGPPDVSGGPPDASASGPPDDSAGGPPMDGSAEGGPPPPDASADPSAGGDPMSDPGVLDPAAIEAELSQMPPEHVKALYLACKSVIFASMGGGSPDGGSAPPGPDAGSAPPMPPGPPGGGGGPPGAPPGPPAMKAEVSAGTTVKGPPANGGETKAGSALGKSEAAKDAVIADLQKKVAEFDGITSALMNVVEKVISVPPRRAVAGVSELAKAAEDPSKLDKAEITARLDRAARTKLHKSDRELINKYAVGSIDVSKVKHLLDIK